MSAIRLRLDLSEAPSPAVPTGFAVAPFRADDAEAVARVFIDSYRDGLAGPFDAGSDWHAVRSDDPEWDAALVLLARDAATNRVVGACHGWTSGFIKDLGVVTEARQRGVGEALILSLAERYRQRGCGVMELKVAAENSPARRLYARMGFRGV